MRLSENKALTEFLKHPSAFRGTGTLKPDQCCHLSELIDSEISLRQFLAKSLLLKQIQMRFYEAIMQRLAVTSVWLKNTA
jgi:hypothetical protein